MKYAKIILFLLWPLGLISQVSQDSVTTNTRYFEDQFYVGVTYNFLLDKPESVSQRNFSYGLQAGFIKDIPLNYKGTIAFGVGAGLALNTYYSNIIATESNEGIQYALPEDVSIKRSKIETHLVEAPIQFRWRNSTNTTYKFWRFYTGIKFGYTLGARSKFVPDSDGGSKVSFTNTDVRNFQYGLTIDFGYNSFNAHIYYALTNILNDGVLLNGDNIKMQPLQVGLIFYIL